MSLATKQELEKVLAALYNDIDKTRNKRLDALCPSEWSDGYTEALSHVLELFRIVSKTYRVALRKEVLDVEAK